jgi:hypothetical protein
MTLSKKAWPHGLYVEDILATFGPRAHGLCVLFFSLPFLQPVPLVGLSTPFGLLLMGVGFFILTGQRLWLPHRLLRQHVSESLISQSCHFLLKILDRTESLIRPRWGSWSHSRGAQILNGFLIILFSFLLALPLPIPFSNALPAWFLVLNSMGGIEEDGVLMSLSYILGIANVIFFSMIAHGGVQALHLIQSQIQ